MNIDHSPIKARDLQNLYMPTEAVVVGHGHPKSHQARHMTHAVIMPYFWYTTVIKKCRKKKQRGVRGCGTVVGDKGRKK